MDSRTWYCIFMVGDPATISGSFQNADPSYADETVSVYRIGDLRDSCPTNA